MPGVVCGVAIILLATGTTLNIESFMGSIMCIGVSVSNSVMLTTFMDDHWRAGRVGPARPPSKGPATGLRPILMTAIAMMLGTVPMALALEEGSEMTAPLGRAVIGGLVVSTFATLLIVPAMFVLVMGNVEEGLAVDRSRRSRQPVLRSRRARRRRPLHGGPRPEEHPTIPGAIVMRQFALD